MRCLLITFCFLVLCACRPAVGVEGTTETTLLRVGLVTDPATFDPHLTDATEVGVVLRQVYDTLVYRHPTTLEFVPGLAANWSVSPDGLEYTFQLKQNVTFHDDTPFNAQAVAANLDRILELGVGGRARALLGPYTTYEVIDDHSIRLRLSEPYAGFMDALSQVYLAIASPVALREYSPQRYQFHQVGTGPFRFDDFLPGRYVLISKNERYEWAPEFYESNVSGALHQVRFEFYTQAGERASALLSDEVDILSRIPPADARSLSVNPQVQIIPLTVPGQPYQLLMNTAQFPTDNVLVRQALLFGTNREEVVNTVLQGFSRPAWSPLTSTTLFFSSGFNETYAYDLLQARSLLESAGFADGDGDGILDIDTIPLEVRVVLLRDELSPSLIDRLGNQWRDAGIRTTTSVAPTRSSLLDIIETGEYNLVAIRADGVEPSFLVTDFAGGGLSNWTNADDQTLTEILNSASSTLDVAERASLYVAAQSTIMQEAYLLPIAESVNLVGTSTRVSDLEFHANQIYPILPNLSLAVPPA